MQSRQRTVAGALGDGAKPMPKTLIDGLEAIVKALAPLS